MPIRTALIEDATHFAQTLRQHIEISGADVDCIGVYRTAEDALEQLPHLKPDVAVVDIYLPGMNGIQLVVRLKELCPSVVCLILTTYEDGGLIFDALKAGASGYLLKRAPAEEIIDAIVGIYRGGSPMSPQIARRVVDFFHQQPAQDGLESLTERERQVLELLSKGLMYKEIADRLGISMGTVRTHITKIYETLHVHSRAEAMLKYFEQARG